MLRPDDAGHPLVGLIPIATGFFNPAGNRELEATLYHIPPRGKNKKRQRRRCSVYNCSKVPLRVQNAVQCKGRGGEKRCPYFLENNVGCVDEVAEETSTMAAANHSEAPSAEAFEQVNDVPEEACYCASYPFGCNFGNGICSGTTTHRCTRCHIAIHCVLCVPQEKHDEADNGRFWCYYCHHKIARN